MENKESKTVVKKKKINITTRIFIICMLALPVLNFLVFWVYTNIDTIFLAFQRFDVFTGKYKSAGLHNFRELFKAFRNIPTRQMTYAVKNSITNMLWNTFVSLPIALVCTYVFFRKIPGYNVFRIIFFLPAIISSVVLTIAYKFSFDTSFGIVNSIIKNVGLGYLLPQEGWFGTPSRAWFMILLYGSWAGVGYNVLLLSGSMSRIPAEVLESARIDGIGMFRELVFIIIPMIFSTITTMLVLFLSNVFSYFLTPMLLTGGNPDYGTYTIAYVITDLVKQDQLNKAAAYGVFFSVIGVPFVLGFKMLLEKLVTSTEY